MRVPIDWLKDFVEFDLSPVELAERLTMAGLEVEEVLQGDVLSVYITPNRGDCLSVFGIAREVYALLGDDCKRTPLFERIQKALQHPESNNPGEAAQYAQVQIDDPDLCARYAARLVRGIKIAPSPAQIQRRLIAADVRPLSSVVDATNYVMLELGQPLHAFDHDTLQEGRIIVRQAREGEKIRTLDNTERGVSPPMLMICDAEKPVAVAGVMGGGNTEVSGSTINLLLESAHFSPLSIRRTSKQLELRTESSYRFERYVDPNLVVVAVNRLCELIEQMTGVQAIEGVIDVYPNPPAMRSLQLRLSRAEHLLGFALQEDETTAALQRLNLQPQTSVAGVYTVQVPPYRQDITREVDLVEEVGRILGYDRIPESPPTGTSTQGQESEAGAFAERIRRVLTGSGLQEVVNGSMEGTSPLHPRDITPIAIRNPMRDELSLMRPTLLASLASSADHNRRHGMPDVNLFEIGHVFAMTGSEPPFVEKLSLGLLMMGKRHEPHWHTKPDEVDFFMLKGVVEHLVNRLGIEASYEPLTDEARFHPGRAASVMISGAKAGVLGELHPDVTEALGFKRKVYAAELDFDLLLQSAIHTVRYQPIPDQPPVLRDLAILIEQRVPYASIESILREAAGDWLETCRLFDRYTGTHVPEGWHSLAFSLSFRDPNRTLTDEEINARMEAIFMALETQFGAKRRT
jgi:phenylalanyl-tRNA synthetase beta chain